MGNGTIYSVKTSVCFLFSWYQLSATGNQKRRLSLLSLSIPKISILKGREAAGQGTLEKT